MSKKIKEITTENFSEAVDYAYSLNRKLTAFIPTQNILVPLGSILFSLHITILALGLIYALVPHPATTALFDAIPFIDNYWNAVFGMVCNISNLLYIQIILMVVYLFLVPFAICSITAIIIFLRTKGQTPSFKGGAAKQAKQLHSYLENAPLHKKWSEDVHRPWRIGTSLVASCCVVAFFVCFLLTRLKLEGSGISSLDGDKKTTFIISFLAIGALYFFVHYQLNYIFVATIKQYFISLKAWKKFTAEAERYWVSVDSEERKRRELEEKEREEKARTYSNSSSSSSSYSSSLTYAQKFDYINRNFGGEYSYAAVEYIRNDSSLSPSEQEEMIIFLRAFG